MTGFVDAAKAQIGVGNISLVVQTLWNSGLEPSLVISMTDYDAIVHTWIELVIYLLTMDFSSRQDV